MDRSVPKELKVAFLHKRFRTYTRVSHRKLAEEEGPLFLGEQLPTPSWWTSEVMHVIDKIMLDKVSSHTHSRALGRTS